MKSKKDIIYEYIVGYIRNLSETGVDEPKVDTLFLSEQLNMQRSNVSTLLNQLVKEGKIIKSQGRPVMYYLPSNTLNDINNDYINLVGYNGSLEDSINMMKVAVSYPTDTQGIILVGEKGTGIESLSYCTYRFACSKGVLNNSSSYSIFNTDHYNDNQIKEILLNSNDIYLKNTNGLLLIKNASQIEIKLLKQIFNHVKELNLKIILVFHLINDDYLSELKEYFNFVAKIPSLNERGMKERFDLIELFIKEESKKINKKIEVNSELMQILLSYPSSLNIDGLKKHIQFGIANAFLKMKKNQNIILELADLPDEVKKGLLYLKNQEENLKELIGTVENYIFTSDSTFTTRGNNKNLDIYKRLDKKKKQLKNNSNSSVVKKYILNNIEEEFQSYIIDLTNDIDENKLKQLVSARLIEKVRTFIEKASKKFNYIYPIEVFYGICLHLNSVIVNNSNKQRVTNEKILEIIEKYSSQYVFARNFIKEIEKDYNIVLSTDETIFITLFLILPLKKMKDSKVVTIVVMHGDCVADSLVKVVKQFMPVENIDALDLPLELSIEESYQILKKKLISSDQGKGILVIYDMGSIQVMLDSIMEETHLNIRYMEMPISLFVMSSCKYSEEGQELNSVYNRLISEYNDSSYSLAKNKNKIIIALSSIRENISKKIRNELLKKEDSNDYNIVDINIDDKQSLINKINNMNTKGNIVAVIGTYNPNLFNLKYVDYYLINEKNTIKDILDEPADNLDVFEYLEQQFPKLSRKNLEITLLPFVTNVELKLGIKINEDTKIGLFIHMASVIERMIDNQIPIINFNISHILKQYPEEIKTIKESLIPLEVYYNITVGDGDIATIAKIILGCI